MPPLPGQLAAPFLGAAQTGLSAARVLQDQQAMQLQAQHNLAMQQMQAQAQAAKLAEQATKVIQGGDPRLANVFNKFSGLDGTPLGILVEESTRSKEASTKELAGSIITQLGLKGVNPKDATPQQLMELGNLVADRQRERRLAGEAAVQNELRRAQTEKTKVETSVKKEALGAIKGSGAEGKGAGDFLANTALFGAGAAQHMAERDPAAIAQKKAAEAQAERIRPVSAAEKALFELKGEVGSVEEAGIIPPDKAELKALREKKKQLGTVKDLAGRVDHILATRGSKALSLTGASTRFIKGLADQVRGMMEQYGIYVDIGPETQQSITSITQSVSEDLNLNASESSKLRTQVFNLALALAGLNGMGEGRSLSDADVARQLESVGVSPSADTFRRVLAENVEIAQGRLIRDFEQHGHVPASVKEPFKPTAIEAVAEDTGINEMGLEELWKMLDRPGLTNAERMAIIRRAEELK